MVDHIRLFPNHPQVRWEHRVHEQILPALRRLGGEVKFVDVAIQHVGYQDRELRAKKLQRDLRLLRLEQAEMPNHPFTLFNLGSVYQELGQPAEALPVLRKSLELSSTQDSIVRKLYALIVGCHRALRQPTEALGASSEGLTHFPDDPELLFVHAVLLREANRPGEAREHLERLLSSQPAAHFASVDTGIRGHKAHHNLAIVLRELNERDKAESHWQQAVGLAPTFLPAWLGLAELYLDSQDWQKAQHIADRLQNELHEEVEADLLRARVLLAQKEYTAARALLEGLLADHPQAVSAWVILSHVLLQEGKDSNEAERVLRRILDMVPDHSEATNNLYILLERRRANEEE